MKRLKVLPDRDGTITPQFKATTPTPTPTSWPPDLGDKKVKFPVKPPKSGNKNVDRFSGLVAGIFNNPLKLIWKNRK